MARSGQATPHDGQGTNDPPYGDLGLCARARGPARVVGMRALVVFESMFGNTRKVPRAVARGLQLEGVDSGLVEVGSAPHRRETGLTCWWSAGPRMRSA